MGSLGRWMVALFVAASLVPLLASNFWGYVNTREYALASARREVREMALRGAADARSFVREAHDMLPSMISGNQHLFATTRALMLPAAATEHATFRQALRIHLAAKASSGQGREFAVLTERGVLLASSRLKRPAGQDWSTSPCVTARTDDDVALHGARNGPEGPELVVSGPVRVGLGIPEAIFCARFSLIALASSLAGQPGRLAGTRISLVAHDGSVIVETGGPGLNRAGTDAGARAGRASLIGRGLAGGADGRYTTSAGEVLAAFAPVGPVAWGMLVEIPVASALSDLERLKWQALWGSTALASLLVLAILVFARALGASLASISAAAQNVARGQLGELVPEQSIAELGDLADAFNRMSRALQASHESLEQRILERTAALERSLDFANLLLDSIDHHVIVVDRDRRITRVNAAARAAYGEALVGAGFERLCEGLAAKMPTVDGHRCAACAVHRTFETGRPDRAERAVDTATGPHIVQLQTWPIGVEGQVEAVVEIGRVVTDERQLQAQMMHQEKMAAFGLLAAGMAHEIGNPLAVIASQLQRPGVGADPERTREVLAAVQSQVERIGRLLRELVDFARRKRDVVGWTNLVAVTDDVCRLLGHDSRARGVRIDNALPADLPPVRLLEDHMVQVLLNLGMNALDAMQDGGELRFDGAVEGDTVVIRVRDSGGGIADAERGRVFAPFFTTKPAGRGTGLGLFVSRNVVAGFGGALTLEATGEAGTVFAISIPLPEVPLSSAGSERRS